VNPEERDAVVIWAIKAFMIIDDIFVLFRFAKSLAPSVGPIKPCCCSGKHQKSVWVFPGEVVIFV